MTVSQSLTPVGYFEELFAKVPDLSTLGLYEGGFQSLHDLAKVAVVPRGEVFKVTLKHKGGSNRVIVVGTRLGNVLMWVEYDVIVKATGHNELIPFIGFNSPLSVGGISLIAHLSNPQGQNISHCLDELVYVTVEKL